MKFLIDFLGCKVNSYEVNALAEELLSLGYEIFNKEIHSEPDIVIINTCAVTETSVKKDKKMIRRYRNLYPNSILIAMGCLTQYQGKYVLDELKADIVLGTSKRKEIPSYIEMFKKNHLPILINEENNSIKTYERLNLMKDISHTRAYVKIQDGCNNFCSYCIIPYIRGRSRSRPKEDIISEISNLIKNGYKEIVLTGIDQGSYGIDLYQNYTFSSLLEEILETFKDLYRLRISSLEESQIDDRFLKLLEKYDNLANHLHIPLQSGSELILKKMNRKYDLSNFKNVINRIRTIRPNISITTDLIIGFPFETDEEFNKTYNFLKEINFSKIHCFPYSKRNGTVASKMENQISDLIKKERVKKVIELSNILETNYKNKFLNKEIEVLFENYDKDKKMYRGHTSNYLEVFYESKENICNKIVSVKLDNFDNVKI